MTKPLHEQLREAKSDGCIRNMLANITNINPDCSNILCRECHKKHIDAIADRIENEYLPIPCDKEGKPWKVGDPVITTNHGEATVAGYLFDGTEWFLGCRFGRGITIYSVSTSCKRPDLPKLDVDGEKIEVGDTVYEVETSLESQVTSTTMMDSDGNTICCKDGCIGELHYKPHELTHKEPDSLEKLRDDVFSLMIENEFKATANEIKDRFTALIERGNNA